MIDLEDPQFDGLSPEEIDSLLVSYADMLECDAVDQEMQNERD